MYYNTLQEYCSGRNLAKHIERNGGKLPKDDVRSFANEILLGLKYIHEEKIIHCDIKPKNISLVYENNRFGSVGGFSAKIAGFGKEIKKWSVEYGEGLGHMRGERVWSEFGKLDWEGWKTLIGESGIFPNIPDYLSDKAKDFSQSVWRETLLRGGVLIVCSNMGSLNGLTKRRKKMTFMMK
ncbi:Protein kinase domain [Arabidopsis thaliana x Arabidopsis arenosa]|uniref:Protein kinase domain-containing protein n=2 Tax=Arabidopsis TaxID=3701 RepID=A0A178VWQ3_ARATH|nr:Protein kinase domain [Arabidopsis thaliana x Arabidopsis arenosa]OAP10256.1 hypothetical protein AXX17_AT2G13890 [Arabidopsis thaliana]